jgi:hypothetical protein
MFGCRTIVFFRGWDYHAEKAIKSRLGLFRFFFGRADAMIVLTERSRATLKQWGFNQKIHLETTLVDRDLIRDVDDLSVKAKYARLAVDNTINLLYLSRIEERKGIFELVRAFKMLCTAKDLSHRFRLRICGDGLAEKIYGSSWTTLILKSYNGQGMYQDGKRLRPIRKHTFLSFHLTEKVCQMPFWKHGIWTAGSVYTCRCLGDFFRGWEFHGKLAPIGDVQGDS